MRSSEVGLIARVRPQTHQAHPVEEVPAIVPARKKHAGITSLTPRRIGFETTPAFGPPARPFIKPCLHEFSLNSRLDIFYCFTSKRLADDQLPGVPEVELARTRHHILVVGRVVVNCETLVFWFTTCGALKLSESSIWIV
jgi:hypothetical protein